MTNRKKKRACASLSTRSAKSRLIYGDFRLPLPSPVQLRPPELQEAENEDGAAPDLAAEIWHLPPGIVAKRHEGPKTKPSTTSIYSGACPLHLQPAIPVERRKEWPGEVEDEDSYCREVKARWGNERVFCQVSSVFGVADVRTYMLGQ
jgi:hypothetical protein